MANTYLQRTESAGNRRTFTWSAWVKRSKIGASQFLAACSYSSSDESYFFFNGSDQLIWQSSSGSQGDVRTNKVFRDTSAWYHIVLAVDTTQATSSNRIRFYVNGVEETSFSNASYPNQDTQLYWNVGGTYYPRIGRRHAASDYFDGLMSHVAHVDGTQLTPSTFGETDAATGQWKIKTDLSPTWGTNGYWILKDGNSVTDQSGQNNNWTVQGGTLTPTQDNPSNVFATWNPLDNYYAASTFSNGNTSLTSGGSGIETYNTSTLGMSSGKFYMELKHNGGSATPFRQLVGITQNPTDAAGQYLGGDNNDSWGYYDNTGNVAHNASTVVSYSTWTQNDIIGVAVDLDNSKLFFAKNGTWQNSSDPANGTNGISIDSGVTYYFAWGDLTTHSNYCQANLGNGYFGTTAVSSAGTNASNNGIFEYDVPTGFTALSTKGLNL